MNDEQDSPMYPDHPWIKSGVWYVSPTRPFPDGVWFTQALSDNGKIWMALPAWSGERARLYAPVTNDLV